MEKPDAVFPASRSVQGESIIVWLSAQVVFVRFLF
jgi:hypothetical protein